MALSQEMIDEEIGKIDKCLVSGKLKDIKIDKGTDCFDTIHFNLSGYNLNSSLQTESCMYDTIYQVFSSIDANQSPPKKGDMLNILVQKNDYKIISTRKIDIDKYPTISTCEPNAVKTNNMYQYGVFGVALIVIVLTIFLLRRRKKVSA